LFFNGDAKMGPGLMNFDIFQEKVKEFAYTYKKKLNQENLNVN
jgi:hypothetical protein